MFCIRQYLSKKKGKKERRIKKSDLVFIQESCMYMYEKSKILICYFLVSCDFRVRPGGQTAKFEQQILPKAYAINCSYFATGAQNTLYKQRKKYHDRIPLLFRIHLCNFVHFQYIQADNRIYVIQWCCCSLHSRDKSGFLCTRQRL